MTPKKTNAFFGVPKEPKKPKQPPPKMKTFVDDKDYDDHSPSGQARIDRNRQYHRFKHSSEVGVDDRPDPRDKTRQTKEDFKEKMIAEKPDDRVPNAAFFFFTKEDHTLGSLLVGRLQKLPFVFFAAYKIAHPVDPRVLMELRVQTDGSITPREALLAAAQALNADLDTLSLRLAREVALKKAEYASNQMDDFANYASGVAADEMVTRGINPFNVLRPFPDYDLLDERRKCLLMEIVAASKWIIQVNSPAEKDPRSEFNRQATISKHISAATREFMCAYFTEKMSDPVNVVIDKDIIRQAIHRAFDIVIEDASRDCASNASSEASNNIKIAVDKDAVDQDIH
ncbi:hypothetical protein N7495_005766 [Penicillium taxi]|uniref:uncharacterized protein n=1 Tax=Penicillium taxi TaxID=168475 RepID=UPI002545AF3B|nr:uncharacterized protein N7495_005766 [Penicillium taxi]KAJ5894075.1 hypothetical protein N7495_005766 [Penicillium taxi]